MHLDLHLDLKLYLCLNYNYFPIEMHRVYICFGILHLQLLSHSLL